MEFVPHKYQEIAIQKIFKTPKAGLFLDMGLGKTVITLTAINMLMYDYFDIQKVLVIAPLRVAEDTWSRESKKWNHLKHLRIAKILGNTNQRRRALMAEADIYIINRENIVWLTDELSGIGNGWDFDMVVIDELSSFKSAKAQRFKALKKYITRSQRVVGLTGTPAPNGLIDLWSQVYLLDGGQRLGSTITGFRERYFTPGQRNQTTVFNYKPKPGAEKAIQDKISDICVSMKAEDWLELPKRIDLIQRIALSQREMAEYESFEKNMVLQFLGGEITAASRGALTIKLLQYCNGAVYQQPSGEYAEMGEKKLDALEDIVEASVGNPVLCFYSFTHDVKRIKKRFPKAIKLEGEKEIQAWNRGEISILLAHPAGAGHGLNLQEGGNIIVWFGLPWSLELYMQANARLHRQGQQRAVFVHHLIASNTVDERVLSSLQGKKDVQEELMQALKVKYGL